MPAVFTFLGVANEHPSAITCNGIPNANRAIVASGHKRATSSCQSTYGMIMAFQVKLVVRVLLNILL